MSHGKNLVKFGEGRIVHLPNKALEIAWQLSGRNSEKFSEISSQIFSIGDFVHMKRGVTAVSHSSLVTGL